MEKLVGRDRDIQALQRSQRAAAVGRLMLGEIKDWKEFLSPETEDFSRFKRRDLKSDRKRFQSGLSRGIRKFCDKNFNGMTEAKLEKLFLKVKERRGLEIPLSEFQVEFAPLRPETLSGAPIHCTVVISLWGLKMMYPEDFLSKDIIEAISQIREAREILAPFEKRSHSSNSAQKEEISRALSRQRFASRSCFLACFNLVEAALNGLAWDFAQNDARMASLSKKKQAVIEDGNFRDKLIKYPEIISGKPLWDEGDERVRSFLDVVKTHRDALVHASPFSRPERFGGLNKLEHVYRIDEKIALDAASSTVLLLVSLLQHIKGTDLPVPPWLEELASEASPRSE